MDIVTVGTILAALAAAGTIAKFWMDVGASRRDSTEALKKANEAADDLADFKTAVAEKYASVSALASSEGRLTQAIEGMRASLERNIGDLTARIDKLLIAVKP